MKKEINAGLAIRKEITPPRLAMPPRTRRSARTGAASSAPSSAASPVLLDVLTTDDLLDLALSFCTEDALRAAYASCRAFRAAAVPHLRRLLSIALVGPTPQNLQASQLGVFLKRDELVNGFASYAKAGDDGAMLWHAAGSWHVGAAADLGQDRGLVRLCDGCLRPEASTVTWKVWDGAAWVDAAELRCLAGRPSSSGRREGRWLDADDFDVFENELGT